MSGLRMYLHIVPRQAGTAGYVVLGKPELKSGVPDGLVRAHAHSSEHSRAVNIIRAFHVWTNSQRRMRPSSAGGRSLRLPRGHRRSRTRTRGALAMAHERPSRAHGAHKESHPHRSCFAARFARLRRDVRPVSPSWRRGFSKTWARSFLRPAFSSSRARTSRPRLPYRAARVPVLPRQGGSGARRAA
jgi:hypothetical protein